MARYVLMGQNDRITVEADMFSRVQDQLEFFRRNPTNGDMEVVGTTYAHQFQGIWREDALVPNS